MFSHLKSEVSIATTVMASAIMLLNGLHEKFHDALANAQNTNDLSELRKITSTLSAETSQLAAAVAANTIADPDVGSAGLTPAPDAPLETGGVDNTVTGEYEEPATEQALVGEDEAAGEAAEATADAEATETEVSVLTAG